MRRTLACALRGSLDLIGRGADRIWAILFGPMFASFGRGSVIQRPLRVHRPQGIEIGARVFLGPGCWLQTLPGPDHPEPRLVIGDGTCVSGDVVLSAACEIVLEPEVLLARNVYVSDHIHRYDDPETPVLAQGLAKLAPVRIRRGAWLGQNVVVCPGVTIGRGSVVGANSVVLDDVPDHVVCVGAPARVVKSFGPRRPSASVIR